MNIEGVSSNVRNRYILTANWIRWSWIWLLCSRTRSTAKCTTECNRIIIHLNVITSFKSMIRNCKCHRTCSWVVSTISNCMSSFSYSSNWKNSIGSRISCSRIWFISFISIHLTLECNATRCNINSRWSC